MEDDVARGAGAIIKRDSFFSTDVRSVVKVEADNVGGSFRSIMDDGVGRGSIQKDDFTERG